MKKLLFTVLLVLATGIYAQKPSIDWHDYIPQASVPTQSEGRLYYDQTSQTLFLWNGLSWVDLGGSGGGSDGVVTGVSLSGQNLNFTGTAPGFIGTVDLSSLVSPYVPLSGATMNSGSIFIAYNFGVRNLQSGGPAAEFYQTDASDNILSNHLFDRGQFTMRVQNDGVSPTLQMDFGINAETDYTGYYIGMSGSSNTAKILKFLNISGSSVGQRTAEFTGRVAGEDGTASDEFVTKGQLDALAANGTGIVAEGTITTDGSGTTYTVSHGLGYAPASTRIQTQRLDDGTTGAESEISIGNITTTTFDIIIESASATGDPIAWHIKGNTSDTPLNGGEVVTAVNSELGGTTWQSGGGSGQTVYDRTDRSVGSPSTVTYTNSNISGTNNQWNFHTQNDTIEFSSSITEYNKPFLIQGAGADSLIIKRNSGDTFYVSDQIAALTEDGVIVKARNTLVVTALSSQVYEIGGGYDGFFVDGYSPDNLYTESSALNADNESAAFGNWERANGTTSNMTIETDAPVVNNGSTRSSRLSGSIGAFGRQELPLGDLGLNLESGVDYVFRFYYKRVAGSTNSGEGLRVRIDQGTDVTVDITEANTGVWTQTSVPFTADTLNPDIWVVGSWGVSTTDDFSITNVEIIRQ